MRALLALRKNFPKKRFTNVITPDIIVSVRRKRRASLSQKGTKMRFMEEFEAIARSGENDVISVDGAFEEGYDCAMNRVRELIAKYATAEAELTDKQTELAMKFVTNRHDGAVEVLGGGILLVTSGKALQFVLVDAGYQPGEKPDKEALRTKAEKATAKFLAAHPDVTDCAITYNYLGMSEIAPDRAYVKYWINCLEEA